MTTTRRLAAVLAADVAGYSRLMAVDEDGTLARFKLLRFDHFEPAIRRHGGRVVGEAGDSLLVDFPSATEAVICAVEVQEKLDALNAELPEDRRMRFRIGINLGEVVVDGATIHGDGVNIAARLEKLAEPGGVVVGRSVHDQVRGKTPHQFEDMGDKSLHNIAEPVRAFRIATSSSDQARQADQQRSAERKVTLAVLPFTNMSDDAGQEYFADGITEDLITALSRFRDFAIVARNSTFTYKGRSVKVQDVGRELGADYVVEGSIQRGGDRIRVTAQLIDTETGTHVWAERFDRDLSGIFTVQDEVVRAIVMRLRPSLVDAAAIKTTRAGVNLTAYDHWLRSVSAWQSGDDTGYREHLIKAVEADANYGVAHSELGFYYFYAILTGRTGLAAEELERLVWHHAERAASTSTDDPITDQNLGIIHYLFGKFAKARHYLERALAVDPQNFVTIMAMGEYLALTGAHAEGLRTVEEVIWAAPRVAPIALECMFTIRYLMRNYEGIVELFYRFDDPQLHHRIILAAALAQLGYHDEMREAVTEFEKRRPSNYDVRTVLRCYVRFTRLPEDKENWISGFRKAGFDV